MPSHEPRHGKAAGMHRLVSTAVVAGLASVAAAGPQQGPPAAASGSSTGQKYWPAITIEGVTETLPPVTLRGRPFTVTVHKRRLVWPAEAAHTFSADDDETAISFEIQDAAGARLYSRALDERLPAIESDLAEVRRHGRLPFSTGVSARRLDGENGQALIVDWAELPSAPDACATSVILGLFDDKLTPFSEPFCEHVITDDRPGGTTKLKKDPKTGAEFFEVREHTGFYSVIIPVRVDFLMAKLLPVRSCIRLDAPEPLREYCEFPVEAERRPDKDETFVRLFPVADESATPKHIVVKPSSAVQFLFALAPNVLDRYGRWKLFPHDELLWLKVRIDGVEGWVRAQEDLNALGLFLAGAGPCGVSSPE